MRRGLYRVAVGLVQDQVKGRRVDRQGRPEVLAGPDRNPLPLGPEPLQQIGDLPVLLGTQLPSNGMV